jgi:hypothetical protein
MFMDCWLPDQISKSDVDGKDLQWNSQINGKL